jgi:lipid II:glycine glycyltransferase (peptidoglycan interpeptide bridge formation enzyme)
LAKPGQEIAIIDALDEVIRTQHLDHIEVSFPCLQANISQLEQNGYTAEVCQSVVIPLSNRNPGELWHGCSAASRRAVRKAEQEGLEVFEAEDERFIEDYDEMCHEVYRTAGRLPHLSKAFYQEVFQSLHPLGQIKVFLVEHNRQVLAGAIFLLYHGTAYYLSGASHDSSLHFRPNNLIQWRFIEWAAGQGYQTYDLGGATVPSITRFKISLGGQLNSFHRVYRATSILSAAARKVYKTGIPLWRRLQNI